MRVRKERRCVLVLVESDSRGEVKEMRRTAYLSVQSVQAGVVARVEEWCECVQDAKNVGSQVSKARLCVYNVQSRRFDVVVEGDGFAYACRLWKATAKP